MRALRFTLLAFALFSTLGASTPATLGENSVASSVTSSVPPEVQGYHVRTEKQNFKTHRLAIRAAKGKGSPGGSPSPKPGRKNSNRVSKRPGGKNPKSRTGWKNGPKKSNLQLIIDFEINDKRVRKGKPRFTTLTALAKAYKSRGSKLL